MYQVPMANYSHLLWWRDRANLAVRRKPLKRLMRIPRPDPHLTEVRC